MFYSMFLKGILLVCCLAMGQMAAASCRADRQTHSNVPIVMEEDGKLNMLGLLVRIRCDQAGGSVSVNKQQPMSWAQYILDIAEANNISPRDVTAKFTILLNTAAGVKVGRWDIDLTQPNIFQGPEKVTLLGEPSNNTVYAIEIISTTGSYAKTQTIKEMNVTPPNVEQLSFVDNTHVLGLASEYRAPKSTCDASSFEVTFPSSVDFGSLKAASLNKTSVTRDFQIALKRKIGVGNCRQETVKPKIKFSHVGLHDEFGNISIPEQNLLFQLFRDDKNQIVLGHEIPMGEQKNQEILINKYQAKISKDPRFSSVKAGKFNTTILFEISYQ